MQTAVWYRHGRPSVRVQEPGYSDCPMPPKALLFPKYFWCQSSHLPLLTARASIRFDRKDVLSKRTLCCRTFQSVQECPRHLICALRIGVCMVKWIVRIYRRLSQLLELGNDSLDLKKISTNRITLAFNIVPDAQKNDRRKGHPSIYKSDSNGITSWGDSHITLAAAAFLAKPTNCKRNGLGSQRKINIHRLHSHEEGNPQWSQNFRMDYQEFDSR